MGCAERPQYGLFSHPKKECVVPHSLPWLFHFIIISSWTSLSCCSIWVEKWVLLFWQVIEANIWLKTLMFLTPPPPFPIGLYCFTSQPWRRMSFIIDDSSPNPPFNACTLKPITFPAGALRVWPMLTSTPACSDKYPVLPTCIYSIWTRALLIYTFHPVTSSGSS